MTAPVSIGTAYGEAAAFLRREKRLLAPLVLALLVLPVTLAQLVQPDNPFDGAGDSGTWLAIAGVAFLIGLVGQMAISHMAMVPNHVVGASLGKAVRRAAAVFAAFALFGLCVSLALVPLILIDLLANGGQKPASAFLQLVSILLVFAAVPKILLLPAIAMVEPIGPWSLLKRTWSASRGHYWRLLGFFLLFLLASQVLVLAASAVVGSVATLAIGAPAPWSVARLAVALTAGLVQGVVGTLYAAMVGRVVVQLAPGAINGQ